MKPHPINPGTYKRKEKKNNITTAITKNSKPKIDRESLSIIYTSSSVYT